MPLPPTTSRARATVSRARNAVHILASAEFSSLYSPASCRLGELHDHREGRREVAEHARELLLHELEPADRTAELLALAYVGDGGLQGAGLDAGGDPGDVGAHRAKNEGDITPRVHALQPGRFGHSHTGEGDEGVLHGAQRNLAADRLEGDAVGASGHQERLDLAFGIAREDGDHVGGVGCADPLLGAVEHPVVALAAGSRGHATGDVAAVIGLGERERALQLEGADERVELGGLRRASRPGGRRCGTAPTGRCRAWRPRHPSSQARSCGIRRTDSRSPHPCSRPRAP